MHLMSLQIKNTITGATIKSSKKIEDQKMTIYSAMSSARVLEHSNMLCNAEQQMSTTEAM